MRSKKRFCVVGIIALMLCIVSLKLSAQVSASPTMSFTLEQPTVKFGAKDPISLHFELKNISDQPITLSGSSGPEMVLQLVGVTVEKTGEGFISLRKDSEVEKAKSPSVALYNIAMLTIPPGKSIQGKMHLKVLFKLDSVGTYQVHLSPYDSKMRIDSLTVPFEVMNSTK